MKKKIGMSICRYVPMKRVKTPQGFLDEKSYLISFRSQGSLSSPSFVEGSDGSPSQCRHLSVSFAGVYTKQFRKDKKLKISLERREVWSP